jgi:DNA mismatch repair protein MutS
MTRRRGHLLDARREAEELSRLSVAAFSLRMHVCMPATRWFSSGVEIVLHSWSEHANSARATLLERFRLGSLDGLGLGEVPLALRAAGGLVRYLDDTQQGLGDNDGAAKTSPTAERAAARLASIPLDPPTTWHAGDRLVLDAQTRRNLELTRTQMGGVLPGSLLWAIDRTTTAMGGRCLRRWIEAPLVQRASILERQAAVTELVTQSGLRRSLRRLLRPMGDLERLAGRAGAWAGV